MPDTQQMLNEICQWNQTSASTKVMDKFLIYYVDFFQIFLQNQNSIWSTNCLNYVLFVGVLLAHCRLLNIKWRYWPVLEKQSFKACGV